MGPPDEDFGESAKVRGVALDFALVAIPGERVGDIRVAHERLSSPLGKVGL